MKTLKRVLVGVYIYVNISILVFVLFFVFSPKANSDIISVSADCYVNGEWIESSAIFYWYGWHGHPMIEKSPPGLELPYFEILEKLGCQIEREENADDMFATIRVNGREFSLVGDKYLVLYENDRRLNYGAERLDLYRGRQEQGKYGPFYTHCDSDTFKEMLKALGFNNITLEFDEEPWVVRLTACAAG